FVNLGVIGRTFDSTVRAMVVVGPVAILLAVGLVMLGVVRHEGVAWDPVVGRRMVDAGMGVAAAPFVVVAAPHHPGSELRKDPAVTPPEAADAIAVLAVPLAPQDGEVPHLVTATSQIPRLGDQLDLRDDRVLVNNVEKG